MQRITLARLSGKLTVIAAAIFLLAIFLRTYHIFSIPIFADEAIYVRWAQVMRAVSSLRFLPLDDGKQPLFMWLTIPFLKVIHDPLIAGRTVSAVAGMGTMIGVFFVSFQLFRDKTASLAAAFLYAISPFSLFFDRMALVDSLLTCFGVWSLYFAILTVQTLRLDTAMLTGFSLGFAYLTKSPGIFFLMLLPSTLIVARWEKKGKTSKVWKLVMLWSVAWIIALAMYNILRLGPNFHMLSIRNKDYLFPFSEVLRNPLNPLVPHLHDIFDWDMRLLPITSLLAACAGFFISMKKKWRESLLLLGWILGPLLTEAAFARVFTARYILFTTPALFIFAALAWKRLSGKYPFLIGGFLLALPSLFIDYLILQAPELAPLPRQERSGYLEEWTAGTGIREISQFVLSEKKKIPTQQIVVGTEGYFGTLPDGLQIYLSDVPGIVVKGVGITLTEVDSSLHNAKEAGNRVFLVVNSTRFKIPESQSQGLSLIASYPKAKRSNGTQESLLLLELIR